jgi:hypothetical protein
MIRFLFMGLWGVLLACGGGGPAQFEELSEEEALEQDSILRDTSTILEVEVPRRDELSFFGVGGRDFRGRFRATANLCEDLRFLELTVRTDSLDTIMLFHLPESEESAAGPYVVSSPMEEYFVVGSVRVGLQLIRGRTGWVSRGIGGSVELTEWGPRMSGTFAVTMREAATEQIMKIRGQFKSVRIFPADEAECAVAASAFVNPDSAADKPDSVVDPVAPAPGG